jgi:hypothetical protein
MMAGVDRALHLVGDRIAHGHHLTQVVGGVLASIFAVSAAKNCAA